MSKIRKISNGSTRLCSLLSSFTRLTSALTLNWVARPLVYPRRLPGTLRLAYALEPQNAIADPFGRSQTRLSQPIVSNQEDSNIQSLRSSSQPTEFPLHMQQTDYRRRHHCKTWTSGALMQGLAYEMNNENLFIYSESMERRINTGISSMIYL